MPWQCRLLDEQPEHPEVGDMWPAPEMITGENAAYLREHYLSTQYFHDHAAHRAPLVVCLPDRTFFCVDCRPSVRPDGGWNVTGEAPNITVNPSINVIGRYHGWLRNGVISDDVEGRKFERS